MKTVDWMDESTPTSVLSSTDAARHRHTLAHGAPTLEMADDKSGEKS
jgi:nitrate reductase alpha subunit